MAVAADSGNGISAMLDFERYVFGNSNLTINLLRRPLGEWICVHARTLLAPNGCGLPESRLFDETGFIGRATQPLRAWRCASGHSGQRAATRGRGERSRWCRRMADRSP